MYGDDGLNFTFVEFSVQVKKSHRPDAFQRTCCKRNCNPGSFPDFRSSMKVLSAIFKGHGFIQWEKRFRRETFPTDSQKCSPLKCWCRLTLSSVTRHFHGCHAI